MIVHVSVCICLYAACLICALPETRCLSIPLRGKIWSENCVWHCRASHNWEHEIRMLYRKLHKAEYFIRWIRASVLSFYFRPLPLLVVDGEYALTMLWMCGTFYVWDSPNCTFYKLPPLLPSLVLGKESKCTEKTFPNQDYNITFSVYIYPNHIHTLQFKIANDVKACHFFLSLSLSRYSQFPYFFVEYTEFPTNALPSLRCYCYLRRICDFHSLWIEIDMQIK